MADLSVRKLSLSTDEMALVYSLINMPDAGKALLFEMYGELSATKVEDKMTTASHSLLARGFARISEKGSVALDETLEQIFTPLANFKNMIQILINETNENGTVVATDYYIGKQGLFTSNEIDMGVIHHLFHGKIAELPEFILKRLLFTEAAPKDLESVLLTSRYKFKMANYPQLERNGPKAAREMLKSVGYNPIIADALSQDICAPVRRGSVIVVNASSETISKKNFEKTGEGFFWLGGKKSSWIMAFGQVDENSVAEVFPGTVNQAAVLLKAMIGRVS